MRIGAKRAAAFLGIVFGTVFVCAGAGFVYANFRFLKKWSVPLPDIRARTDSAVIARGRYLVYGPARCSDCHSPDSKHSQLFRGEEVPLTGGSGERTYLGDWAAPNLTPDSATGIGKVSDAQLARMFRYGVDRDGHIALPFMDGYADLTQGDMVAIISFLRSLHAESGIPPTSRINTLGKIGLAFFIKPYGPKAPPPENLTPEPSIQYGSYLANTVCGCRSCHTARNLKTGDYESPFFSGGLPFKARDHSGYVYVSPNLTPDSATGHITGWSEAAFFHRIRAGFLYSDSPMPWECYPRMTDNDILALYRYLHSLAPVHRNNDPVMQPMKGPAAG